MADDEWLTIQQAAKLSGYHAEYLRIIVRAGRWLPINLVLCGRSARNPCCPTCRLPKSLMIGGMVQKRSKNSFFYTAR
jgi:hypothetical protein